MFFPTHQLFPALFCSFSWMCSIAPSSFFYHYMKMILQNAFRNQPSYLCTPRTFLLNIHSYSCFLLKLWSGCMNPNSIQKIAYRCLPSEFEGRHTHSSVTALNCKLRFLRCFHDLDSVQVLLHLILYHISTRMVADS